MNRLKPRAVAPGKKSDWDKLKEIDKSMLEAFEAKDFEKADKLILSGANVNVHFGQIKDTALHFFDDIDIVTELVNSGASVSVSNRFHESPLAYACKFGRHRDIIHFLMRSGAYVNKQVNFGRLKMIPLTIALEKMNDNIDLEIIETLLYYGANMDYAKMFSGTPFITALLHQPEMAKIMIKYSVLKIWDKYRFLRMGCIERRQLIRVINAKHLPYLDDCIAEVARMKEVLFNAWHSLYDICRGTVYFQTYTEPYASFLNTYKTDSFKVKYPIYIDVLLKRFDFIRQKRSKLLLKLDDVRMAPKFKKNKECKRLNKTVALNSDCLRHVAQFLPNCDIERLVRAAQ